MGQKSFSTAAFWGKTFQFFIAGFVASLILDWLAVVGWLKYKYLLFGVFTASLVFIDQRLVARFRRP